MARIFILAAMLAAFVLLQLQRSNAAPGEPAQMAHPAKLYAMPSSFAESFDGKALDRRRWRTSFGPGPDEAMPLARRSLYGNRERQVYVAPEYLGLGIDPFAVAGGQLTITARPLDAPALAAIRAELARLPARQRKSALKDVRYSSGLISSRGHFCQRHGYFEARMRWSGGRGIWPAFWLLPADGSWPPEIDVIEAHGDKPQTIFQSRHWTGRNMQTHTARLDGNPAEWHDYGVLWTPRWLVYFIDGRPTARLPAPPGADQPMCLTANLAIGGYWPKDPTPETPFPARLEIDAIRAWALPQGWRESDLDRLGEALPPAE